MSLNDMYVCYISDSNIYLYMHR